MWTLSLIVGFVVAIGWYLYHRLTYWQQRGVPTPGLRYQWNYYTRELPKYDLELFKQLGHIYGVMEGLKPILIVSDPDSIRDILVKDFSSFPNHKPFRLGDPIIDLNMFSLDGNNDWKRIRSLLSPTFTSGKLRSMEGLVNSCVQSLKKNLGVAAELGEVIDAKKYFSNLSFDAVARCAYGAQIDSMQDPNNQIQKNYELIFSAKWSTLFSLLFPKTAKATGILERAMRPAQFFLSMIKALIDERSQAAAHKIGGGVGGKAYNDFLQTMVEANQEAMKDSEQLEGQGQQLKKTLSRDEMVAQALIFLLGGFETTATTMAAMAYHLAKNPKLQEKLISEVSTLTEYTYDSVINLKYLEACLKETFRLSPPFVRVERECVVPTSVGNVKIEPGMVVSIPTYVVHRDPSQYPDPEVFDPERFMDGGASVDHHPYAHLPFGAGPRICIAQRFALMEIKLAFAQILKDYHFEETPETKMSFTPASLDTLAPLPIMVKVARH